MRSNNPCIGKVQLASLYEIDFEIMGVIIPA